MNGVHEWECMNVFNAAPSGINNRSCTQSHSWTPKSGRFKKKIKTQPLTVEPCPRRGGGHSTFFQVGVCGPDFRTVGLANWYLPLKRGACELKISKFMGLWTENFQIWAMGAYELKISKFGLKFEWKLRLWRLKFPNFLKRGSCELTLLLEMGPLRTTGEAWKGGLQGRTSPYPLSRSVPPPGRVKTSHVLMITYPSRVIMVTMYGEHWDFYVQIWVFIVHNWESES